MKRNAALAALLVVACSYDFDRYASPPEAPGAQGGEAGELASGATAGKGGAGRAGSAGTSAGGKGGSAGAGPGGGNGAGEGGSAGTGGAGGSEGGESGESAASGGLAGGGTTAGTPGVAGTGGGGFDCAALSGTTWNGHCYFSVGTDGGLAFDAAAAACAATEGAHLVAITSADEQAAVEAAFFPAATDFWIGLSTSEAPDDPSLECELIPDACPFEWITAEALDFTDWAVRDGDDEPNYTGSCVRIQATDLAWADFGCSSALPAICER